MDNSFRTAFRQAPIGVKLNYRDDIQLIGSCFSQNLSYKLLNAGFNVQYNPFGIQYNPISLFQSLMWLKGTDPIPQNWIEEVEFGWISWMHHQDKRFSSEVDLKDHILESRNTWCKAKSESPLFITLGTAWVYELVESNFLVANCHKQAGNLFNKRMLSVDEVVELGREYILSVDCPVIFTISPVRHLRDGFIENQRSKSVLHLAIQKWEEEFEYVYYFPAYELVLDDLRDYRFFKDDMLHPNELAVNYIWTYLQQTMMDEKTQSLTRKVEKVMKAVRHRPLHPASDSWQKHIQSTIYKLEALQEEGAIVSRTIEQMQQLLQENR
jgi:hypothetical protein